MDSQVQEHLDQGQGAEASGGTSVRRKRSVGILVFDEVEVLDFCGPFEVFSVTSHLQDGVFNVFTMAAHSPVLCRNSLSVNPHFLLGPQGTLTPSPASPAPKQEPPASLDILLVPGGYGSRPLLENKPVLDWVTAAASKAELVLSVCTGSLVLAKLGLLDNLQATTHHLALDDLRKLAPSATVFHSPDRRYFDSGRIVTSAGIAAGIDMSLHVVGRLLGRDKAQMTAKYMEYPYQSTI